jgi:hypothetical protein
MNVLIGGIDPRLARSRARRRDAAGCLNRCAHNPPRESKREEPFLIFLGCNPLKSLDLEK